MMILTISLRVMAITPVFCNSLYSRYEFTTVTQLFYYIKYLRNRRCELIIMHNELQNTEPAQTLA